MTGVSRGLDAALLVEALIHGLSAHRTTVMRSPPFRSTLAENHPGSRTTPITPGTPSAPSSPRSRRARTRRALVPAIANPRAPRRRRRSRRAFRIRADKCRGGSRRRSAPRETRALVARRSHRDGRRRPRAPAARTDNRRWPRWSPAGRRPWVRHCSKPANLPTALRQCARRTSSRDPASRAHRSQLSSRRTVVGRMASPRSAHAVLRFGTHQHAARVHAARRFRPKRAPARSSGIGESAARACSSSFEGPRLAIPSVTARRQTARKQSRGRGRGGGALSDDVRGSRHTASSQTPGHAKAPVLRGARLCAVRVSPCAVRTGLHRS
jgi:hypothetical protein